MTQINSKATYSNPRSHRGREILVPTYLLRDDILFKGVKTIGITPINLIPILGVRSIAFPSKIVYSNSDSVVATLTFHRTLHNKHLYILEVWKDGRSSTDKSSFDAILNLDTYIHFLVW